MKVPLFFLKNALGPRYKAFYIFFVIPLRGHFYPSKNEKNLPKQKFSINIYAYPTKYAGSKKVQGNFTFMTRSTAHAPQPLPVQSNSHHSEHQEHRELAHGDQAGQ